MTKLKSTLTLTSLISSVPSEMLYEIFANLPFGELLNIFTLNREIYNLLMDSEYFFEKLCAIYCNLNDINESEYGKAIENVKKRKEFKNLYYSTIIELISCFGYKWDTQFKYYNDQSNKYELTPYTIKSIAKPSHGEFYTVKSARLLHPGRFYKWKIRVDKYQTRGIGNNFKIMIGIESLNFFPFRNQSSRDVISWLPDSKGIALIIGTNEICGHQNTKIKLNLGCFTNVNQVFKTGDIIQTEFDLRNVPDVEPLQPINGECSTNYSTIEEDAKFMGLVRFSLIRDGEIYELKSWLPYGDVRFAPFVPAVSVNKGQTISFV